MDLCAYCVLPWCVIVQYYTMNVRNYAGKGIYMCDWALCGTIRINLAVVDSYYSAII